MSQSTATRKKHGPKKARKDAGRGYCWCCDMPSEGGFGQEWKDKKAQSCELLSGLGRSWAVRPYMAIGLLQSRFLEANLHFSV